MQWTVGYKIPCYLPAESAAGAEVIKFISLEVHPDNFSHPRKVNSLQIWQKALVLHAAGKIIPRTGF